MNDQPTQTRIEPKSKFDFTLRKAEDNFNGQTVVLILSVPVAKKEDLAGAIGYLNSFELKKQVEARKSEFGLSSYGMSVANGFESVDAEGNHATDSDKVAAVERRLKFTKNV